MINRVIRPQMSLLGGAFKALSNNLLIFNRNFVYFCSFTWKAMELQTPWTIHK